MDIESPVTQVPKHLQFRVALLLAVTLVIVVGFVAYVLYARGVFEAVQKLTLVSDNAEGVSVRMAVTFSGVPIGVVRRITLGDDGKARIEVDVPQSEAVASVYSIVMDLDARELYIASHSPCAQQYARWQLSDVFKPEVNATTHFAPDLEEGNVA